MFLSHGDSTPSKTKRKTNKNIKQKNNCKKCYEGKNKWLRRMMGEREGQGKVSTLNRPKDI